MPTEREEGDGRGINVRSVRHAERHPVAGVPSTTWAHSIEEHADAHPNSFDHVRRLLEAATTDLPECDHTEGCRDDPARGPRHPVPSVLSVAAKLTSQIGRNGVV